MKFHPIVLPEAQRDLDEGIAWYSKEKKGLGRKFAAAVRQVVKGLRRMPKRHAVVFKDVRRAVVKGFPYVVYYRVIDPDVVVISIFHSLQDPEKWQSRV
ncbi:MAG: type II toxin-antitoxin system RelE/ParE family toxin [Planctomycetes bacterium]|nr:type II toxin-antitoxin system RelE/ParE family toxin [Planctomycetota bacterium]